ncbi:hypothetical protein WS73_05930 [Burkholderia savannae]|nr:hypothetical protein WS73_05930 [Burkholderia savannae]
MRVGLRANCSPSTMMPPYRRIAVSPYRRIAASPHRRFAPFDVACACERVASRRVASLSFKTGDKRSIRERPQMR